MANPEIITHCDLLTILEITNEMVNVNSNAEFITCFTKIKSLISYDMSFALHLDNKLFDNTKTRVYNYLTIGFPSNSIESHIENNSIPKCPVFMELQESFNSNNLKIVSPKSIIKDQLSICCGCCGQVCNFLYGWSCGFFHLRQNTISIFAFAGKSFDNDDRVRFILKKLVPHLAESLKRISDSIISIKRKKETFNITPREIEVLKWLTNGKSSWEISVILKCSERVVYWHVENIMKKLDAVNRTHAVAIALHHRLLEIAE